MCYYDDVASTPLRIIHVDCQGLVGLYLASVLNEAGVAVPTSGQVEIVSVKHRIASIDQSQLNRILFSSDSTNAHKAQTAQFYNA